ncbi:MAG: hypothetical protein JJ974_00555 [Phycisphaerales bacterium]|nr:hypothetical protein [Phycisphaerales bacterium]
MEHPRDHSDQSKTQDLASEISRAGFFIAGIVLIVAAAILPLRADLEWTTHQRNLALVQEQENAARNASYQQMIDAIDQQNPDTLRLLAQSNLGVIPADHNALVAPGAKPDPMVFELLEPTPLDRPEFAPRYSRLERLVMVPETRLWVIAGGMLLVLLGLLPQAKPSPRAQTRRVVHAG